LITEVLEAYEIEYSSSRQMRQTYPKISRSTYHGIYPGCGQLTEAVSPVWFNPNNITIVEKVSPTLNTRSADTFIVNKGAISRFHILAEY
jgi:hypothetical protein